MSLVKRNDVLFPAFMNEIFKPDWFGGIENNRNSVPAVNIKENEKEYYLELFVPGRSKEDFTIEIDEAVLTISSEIKKENEEVNDNYTRKEFSISSFKRSFTLPDTIATDKIDANYEGGILKFNLPKKEEALPKPKRMIELK
ncbi:MAG: Hsp20/alpha crystallin family protein [Maribacter dokdonensis]|uniref:Hsp20/alpha crystallin family protein n=1 Tax=Maribacter TaxID=252356 RepID=UPI0007198F0B|nr:MULTISPECIES: Hsp20/alpha crystallin family protein [Maribacter]KSA14601.1 Heat shock protein Hsp20 [Maribacter dokdonensis DSW-8]MBU2899698.1 Hsp20/alpha crystallin family protein [Maribacter dokdonensis]MDP2526983.1 Hsp20/alpha crystallin family protein [Maribacter dokdonensis]CAG2532217.1 HSP20 family protein [Maribacter dokdonensis]|tara:strand:+ start:585 stop:1010 length:426 start_codon:yes stop_codon:yes gene_type:complete